MMAMGNKRIQTSDGSSTAKDEDDREKQATFLSSLPDVPLLKILSFLEMKDLGAAGWAIPWLGDLIRAHRWLWQRKSEFTSVEDFLPLLRLVAPSISRLLISAGPSQGQGVSEKKAILWFRRDTLCVVVERGVEIEWEEFHSEWNDSLVLVLAPHVKEVKLSCPTLELLLDALQHAHCLESLHVMGWAKVERERYGWDFSLFWPQAVVLPHLHSVSLDFSGSNEGDASFLIRGSWAFRSLLKAHSCQLSCVELYRKELQSLVDVCPTNLKILDIEACSRGVSKSLRRLSGLRELRLEVVSMSLWEEVQNLLRTWPGPLESLELAGHRHQQVLHALGSGGLKSLQHLVLAKQRRRAVPNTDDTLYDLRPALAGLPRLRSVILVNAPIPEIVSVIHPANIPALEILIYVLECCPKVEIGFEDFLAVPIVAQLSVELRELARRTPRPLHTLLVKSSSPCCPEIPVPELQWRVFSRHPEADKCQLCVEAADLLSAYTNHHRIK